MKIQIFNNDCLLQFPKIKNKIDLVVVDLPYGQTACSWDVIIDFKKMWNGLKKICKQNCIYIFFCTTKFGYKIIQSNEKWFRYDLVWEKSNSVGFLSVNKMPLRKHEMIYVFKNDNNNDLNNSRNSGLRRYSKKVLKFINRTKCEINRDLGNRKAEHFFQSSNTQFALPTNQTYDILIEKYKINEMDGFRTIEDLRRDWVSNKKTYNPQKTKGKPYKSNAGKTALKTVYGSAMKTPINNKGARYPTSVLKFSNPKKSLHMTQKPVDLLKWLINTYSNEGDTVLDFCMGSGSTGIACLETGRNFIGIEKDKNIFKTAKHRLIKYELIKLL